MKTVDEKTRLVTGPSRKYGSKGYVDAYEVYDSVPRQSSSSFDHRCRNNGVLCECITKLRAQEAGRDLNRFKIEREIKNNDGNDEKDIIDPFIEFRFVLR